MADDLHRGRVRAAMSSAGWASIVVATAVLVAHAQQPARDASVSPSPTGAVRGRVVAAESREPIRRARVDLVAATGGRRDPVYADSEGRFEFTAVSGGRYTLSAWKSGYVATTYGARTFWEPAAVIALEPGQSASGVEIGLAKGASMSGRIVDDAGDPLSDMQVTVGRAAPVNGRLQMQSVSLPATTDDRGEYRVGGLPAGTFVVSVFGWVASAAAAGDAAGPRPHAIFYPQTPFVSQARPVTLKSGEDLGSIDVSFATELLATPTVSGRVVDPRGVTVQASLFASSNGDGVSAAFRGLTSGVRGSGEFTLRLDPGEYTVTAQADDLVATTRVAVDRADVTGVELVLAKSGRIAGRVVFEGTAARPPEGFTVRAFNTEMPGGFDRPVLGGGNPPARLRPDGSFVLSGLVGTYDLRVMPDNRGWRPKSISAGGRNLLDVPMAVKNGDDVRDVLIVMTDRSAALEGTVVGVTPSALAAGLSVLIFPNDGSQAARRARWVRPDQNGRFAVADLSPGAYLLATAADVDDLQWQTAAYLDRFRAASTRVTLGDGETKSVSLEWTERR